jgi:hypothetical protein
MKLAAIDLFTLGKLLFISNQYDKINFLANATLQIYCVDKSKFEFPRFSSETVY